MKNDGAGGIALHTEPVHVTEIDPREVAHERPDIAS